MLWHTIIPIASWWSIDSINLHYVWLSDKSFSLVNLTGNDEKLFSQTIMSRTEGAVHLNHWWCWDQTLLLLKELYLSCSWFKKYIGFSFSFSFNKSFKTSQALNIVRFALQTAGAIIGKSGSNIKELRNEVIYLKYFDLYSYICMTFITIRSKIRLIHCSI